MSLKLPRGPLFLLSMASKVEVDAVSFYEPGSSSRHQTERQNERWDTNLVAFWLSRDRSWNWVLLNAQMFKTISNDGRKTELDLGNTSRFAFPLESAFPLARNEISRLLLLGIVLVMEISELGKNMTDSFSFAGFKVSWRLEGIGGEGKVSRPDFYVQIQV